MMMIMKIPTHFSHSLFVSSLTIPPFLPSPPPPPPTVGSVLRETWTFMIKITKSKSRISTHNAPFNHDLIALCAWSSCSIQFLLCSAFRFVFSIRSTQPFTQRERERERERSLLDILLFEKEKKDGATTSAIRVGLWIFVVIHSLSVLLNSNSTE